MTGLSIIPRAQRRLRLRRRPSDSIHPSSPRPQRRDCHGRLITALIELAGESCQVEDASMRPWCSATFMGMQHFMLVTWTGDVALSQALEFANRLPEAEFQLPGHVVVDAAADSQPEEREGLVRLPVTILTIEDW